MQDNATYNKFVAYATMFIILYALSKTGLGYKAMYYSLWLILVFLMVTNAPKIGQILAPIAARGNT